MAVGIGALAIGPSASGPDAPFDVEPFEFDPDGTGIVFAGWVKRLGLPDDRADKSEGLLLSKNGATTAFAAAGATVEGAEGIVLDELGFDVRSGGHCGAGAPRFNVVADIGGTPKRFFFGCFHGDKAAVPGVSPVEGWTRVRFTDADAFPADGFTVWPGFGSAVVVSIHIIFDEGTDTGPDHSGMVVLDNIDINGVLVGRR